ncbi:hypothetical protein GYB59_11430 [bacterium]|nr:hypothetical protein [bacterium]
METSLHQQLKEQYLTPQSHTEQQLGRYRIDVITGTTLIEIQCSSLAAIRDKVKDLTPDYTLRVVKPLVHRKRVISKKWSLVTGNRMSKTVGSWIDLFDELIHFVTAFPRRNLVLEALLVDIEEVRRPSRKRHREYRVEDRSLLQVVDRIELEAPADLYRLIPADIPDEFTTLTLAERLDCPRWLAQKIAYCLRETSAATAVGKQGNSIRYRRCETAASEAA